MSRKIGVTTTFSLSFMVLQPAHINKDEGTARYAFISLTHTPSFLFTDF